MPTCVSRGVLHTSVGGAIVSQLFPGPTSDRSRTVQTHLIAKDASEAARTETIKRADFLEWVVNEEDYKTALMAELFGDGQSEPRTTPDHQRSPSVEQVGGERVAHTSSSAASPR